MNGSTALVYAGHAAAIQTSWEHTAPTASASSTVCVVPDSPDIGISRTSERSDGQQSPPTRSAPSPTSGLAQIVGYTQV